MTTDIIYLISGTIALVLIRIIEKYLNKHHPEIMKDPEE